MIKMTDYCGVWRDPISGKIFKASSMKIFEAQLIRPEDIESIEAKVVLEEVLGLARQILDPTQLGLVKGSVAPT